MKVNKNKAFQSQRISTPIDNFKEKNSIFNIPGFMINSNNFQGKLKHIATTNDKNTYSKYEVNENDLYFMKSEKSLQEISIDELKNENISYIIKDPEIIDKANKNFYSEKIEKKQIKINIDDKINDKIKTANKYEEDNIENDPKMNLNISAIQKKDFQDFNDEYVISDSFDSIDSFKVKRFKKNLVKQNVFYGFDKNIKNRNKQNQKQLSKSTCFFNNKNESNLKSNKIGNDPMNILPKIGNTKETNDSKPHNFNRFFLSYVLKLTDKQIDVKKTESIKDYINLREHNIGKDLEIEKNKNCIDSIGIGEHKNLLINNKNINNENKNFKSIIIKSDKNDNLFTNLDNHNSCLNKEIDHLPKSSKNLDIMNLYKNSNIYNSEKKYDYNCENTDGTLLQLNDESEKFKRDIILSSNINTAFEKDNKLTYREDKIDLCREIQVKDIEGIKNEIENYPDLSNNNPLKENIEDLENKNNLINSNENKILRKESKQKSKYSFKSDLKLIVKSSLKVNGNIIPQNKTTQNISKNSEGKKTLLKKNIHIINNNKNTNNKIKLMNIDKLEEKFEILKKTNKPKFQVVHKFGGGLIKSIRKIDKEMNLMIDFIDKTKCRSHSKISDLKIFHKEKKFNK